MNKKTFAVILLIIGLLLMGFGLKTNNNLKEENNKVKEEKNQEPKKEKIMKKEKYYRTTAPPEVFDVVELNTETKELKVHFTQGGGECADGPCGTTYEREGTIKLTDEEYTKVMKLWDHNYEFFAQLDKFILDGVSREEVNEYWDLCIKELGL
ncbi:MAG: hypothetical protein IKQ35_02925 [Bacilli bacterium]|nr:hypothetical protein [Bacilli bacterium]